MESARFSEVYPRQIGNTYTDSKYGEQLSRAAELSGLFGEILHDALNTGFERPKDTREIVRALKSDYAHFVTEDLRALETEILKEGDPEHMRHLGLINYHWLNFSMLPMWSLVLQGNSATPKQQKEMIFASRDLIAFDGCEQYVWRDRLADRKQNYRYFDDDMSDIRAMIEGRLHERDAAIVLLDIAQRNNLLVVPAPIQFEDTDPRVNADFIVCDPNNQSAIGIQVKSKVNDQHRQTYNPEFVVLVDGQVDLGNSKVTRTSHQKTTPRSVSWAGIISAHTMTQVRTHGEYRSFLMKSYPEQAVLKAQFDSKIRLAGMKCDTRKVAERLEPRILSKLAVQDAKEPIGVE